MSKSSTIGKLIWYFNRLRSMGPSEILHRVREQALKSQAKRWQRGWARFKREDASLPFLPIDIQLDNAAEEDQQRWRQIAKQAVSRQFSFLGKEWPPIGHNALWHFDPVSGKDWPNAPYCFDINYRHSNEFGDIKYVWEVNRLQYLQPIAALAGITGNSFCRQFALDEIESWIDSNPPFQGVNWASGIELALRAFSVLLSVRFLGAEAFSQAQTQKIDSLMAATALWLHRYPSRYSSANNHLIAEGFGLYLIGSSMPDHPDAAIWKTSGKKVLEEEAVNQIFDDGIGVEQSPTYSSFSIEMLLIAKNVGQASGDDFKPEFNKRLLSAANALTWFLDESGLPPRIGDDDEGRVIYDAPFLDKHYVASVTDAVLKNDASTAKVKLSGASVHLRNLLLEGIGQGKAETEGVHVFPYGGYTILRDRISGKEALWCIDHGPLGYLGIAAHGHADVLSLWLHYNGRAILADAGTYLYHSGGLWRDRFRGTQLHNALSISGQSSSRIAGAFNWSEKAHGELLSVNQNPDNFSLHARHGGFRKQFGVLTNRQIERISLNTFALSDWLDGPGTDTQNIEISFLAGRDLDIIEIEKGEFMFRDETKEYLKLIAPKQLHPRIEFGSDNGLGWISPEFGVKIPAAQIVLSGDIARHTRLKTLLVIPE